MRQRRLGRGLRHLLAEAATVARGVAYLESAPRNGAKWDETLYTGIGFPRVFYLRYDGYSAYFPLWALARYRNLCSGCRPAPRLRA